MKERLVACLAMLILSSDSFLASMVGGQVSNLIVAIPFVALAYLILVVRPALSPAYRDRIRMLFAGLAERKLHAWAFGLYLALFLFSFARAVQFGTFEPIRAAYVAIKWFAVVTVLVGVTLDADDRGERAPLLRTLVIGSAIYSVVNLFALALGIVNPVLNAEYLSDPGPSSMLAAFGMIVQRTPLPLSAGLNTSGLQVAAGVAFGYALMRGGEGVRGQLFGALLAGSTVVALLLTDSRGGALGAGAGVVAALVPGRLRQRSRWLAILLPALPGFLFLFVMAFQDSAWMLNFQRSGAESLGGGLTGRPYIWAIILLFLGSFSPTHLIGYGALGQISSGVSARYAPLFVGGYANPYGLSAHNTVLQAVLDTGYVGAFLQILLFWCLLDTFGRESAGEGGEARWGLVGYVGTVTLMFIGITGDTLGNTSSNTLLIFLALNIHCLTRSLSPSPTPQR
jgi:hypothetical protein